MASKPQMELKPVKSCWPARAGQKVVAIVDHITAGGKWGVLEHFSNPDNDASSNYLVNRDGSIWEFVAPSKAAWANGILQNPDMNIGWLAECVNQGLNPNRRTISIEHEGTPFKALTEEQYQATLKLHLWLVEVYQIPVDAAHIIGHYVITGIDRANCPGPVFPWARLYHDLQVYGSQGQPEPAGGAGGGMTFIETGYNLNNEQGFLDFWLKNGGLAIFGFPITGARPMAGQPQVIEQWFERARFEAHPGGGVMLGLVGAEALSSR